MNRWFRFYQGTCEDIKFRMVARNADVTVATVIGVWACLLEDAAHPDHRGVACRGVDLYAEVLGISGDDVMHVLQFMEQFDCIVSDGPKISITNWKERQFETDVSDPTAADRQQRWRDKHKTNTKQTKRNGTVTVALHPETEADTETETEKKDVRSVAIATRPIDDDWPNDFRDRFWSSYPRKVGKQGAIRELERVRQRGVSFEQLIAAVRIYAATADPKFTKHPKTWLINGCWDDEPLAKPLPVEADIPGFYAAFGSEQLDVWDKTKPGGYPRDKAGGWRFPTEWPPGHKQEAA